MWPIASGLSTEVVETILQSRAPSMRKLYALKWKLFTSWCRDHQLDPVNCPVGTVLEFLQARLSAGLTHSTLKVYVAAISAYHASLGGQSVGRHPLVTHFLRGALRLRPPVLQAFSPPPFREHDQQKLNCMCPVRALDAYVHRAAMWRKADQLLVCFGPPKRGRPASKQTLSRWIVDAIHIAYESSELPSPMGVKAHSTRSVAASKAFLAGVPIQDICNAGGWSTPLTFVRFYGLDMRATPGSSILSP